ncbi:MAG: hypothetical protein HUU21_03840 [Polyangiaceae bacterium]|nr:hypothetical protein [Polyangiaceae bacterium]
MGSVKLEELRPCSPTRRGDEKILEVEKVYQRLREWDPPTYNLLVKRFEFFVGVVEDLAVELTRAANLICDMVRQSILPNYRLEEGLVVITAGAFGDLSYMTYRPRYAPGTKPSAAYEGLNKFLIARDYRDINFGSGPDPEDPNNA